MQLLVLNYFDSRHSLQAPKALASQACSGPKPLKSVTAFDPFLAGPLAPRGFGPMQVPGLWVIQGSPMEGRQLTLPLDSGRVFQECPPFSSDIPQKACAASDHQDIPEKKKILKLFHRNR